MKNMISKLLVAVLTPAFLFSELTITSFDSAEAMAQSLVGPGIQISNVEFTGREYSAGYFTGGYAPGNDIKEGLILTSGRASAAVGPNQSDSTGYATRSAGNNQLGSLIPGYNTYDATILSFDFVSSGDAAYFNFSFASEEYTEWVNSSYNDVFGFFVNGENVALIPGTETPVSINTVSDQSNPELFNNNDLSFGEAPYPFEYDGFTDVFTASITGLTPGESYNIVLGVADAGDRYYDSAVFLEAGTFSSAPVDNTPSGAPEPELALLMAIGVSSVALQTRMLRQKSA